MNLTNPAELKELLVRHGLRPQKKWGQHFLVSPQIVERIVSRLSEAKGVLEVGPGPGVLTSQAARRCEKLVAVEIDPVAVSALSETAPKAIVVYDDALKCDLRELLVGLPSPRAILSNMPYNITGPLLGRIAELSTEIERAVLMMQKEVGLRILAKAGNADRGYLSVWLQSIFEIHKVCDVPQGAFYPPPNVASVVMEFIPLTQPLLNVRSLAIAKAGFAQPRKTLVNNLRSISRHPESALLSAGLDSKVRAHQIEIEQWNNLAVALLDERHNSLVD